MELGSFEHYLIGINILGFILFVINTLLYTYTVGGHIDTALTIVSLLGGSLGIIIAISLIDRKAEKGNMMSRVFVICVLIIQIIIVLMIKGFYNTNITFDFWKFFGRYKVLLIYLSVINIVAFTAYGMDKYAAIVHKSRIKIVTLLGLAFIGGSVGSLLAMYLFRHKTRMDYFTVGVPLIMGMQIVLIFYLMNVIRY